MTRLTAAERERRDKLVVAHYLTHHSQRKTAEAYGVSRMTVCRIIARHVWELKRSATAQVKPGSTEPMKSV